MDRPDHKDGRRLERSFPGAQIQGWYRPDLGTLNINAELWTLSLFDRSFKTYGWRNRDGLALIADNSFLGSVVYNLFLTELGRQIAPDLLDYDQLLVGNLKLYLAEAHLAQDPKGIGRPLFLEYLIDFDAKNLELLHAIRDHDFGFPPEQTFGSFATFQVLLHEVGHFAYSDEPHNPAIDLIREWFRETGVGVSENLVEETYCDLFAAVNCVTTYYKEGFDVQTARALTDWARQALFLVQLLVESVQTEEAPPQANDYSDHDLMLRHRCVCDMLDRHGGTDMPEAQDKQLDYTFTYKPDRLLRAVQTLTSEHRPSATAERMAAFFLQALDEAPADPFGFIYANAVQTWRLRDDQADINLGG